MGEVDVVAGETGVGVRTDGDGGWVCYRVR